MRPREQIYLRKKGVLPARGDAGKLLRSGESPAEERLRFGESPVEEFLRSGESPADEILRFGELPVDEILRFGEPLADEILRFGEPPADEVLNFGELSAEELLQRWEPAGYEQDVRLGEIMSFGAYSLPGEEEAFVDSAPHRVRHTGNVWESERRALDLQYSIQESPEPQKELQNKMRMQEEAAQLKSAQEQLDRKLKEVETQLQKVETAAKAREDVRAFAEKVKSQLYEELHVEKLRRGLV